MAGSPDCEPAAVCRRYSSSAYRAAVSAYQTSGNNKQRHAVLAEWQRWEGATMPCSNTRTDYKHLHTILPSCGGRTHAAAVRWEWRTVRHLCRVRCVEAFEGQVKLQTVK